ncbi:DUF2922 domain-containing protein [Furfurilactobacillus curtus]|uniref:DUF2922 domain-containing protein n=1 Tax=Furfurilactobacillus curtus TaxID=1746200 RepID=A0ABQ5JPG8_9LACO
MKNLSLKFTTAAGKNVHLTIRNVNQNLSQEVVRAAMQDMIDAQLITDKKGIQQYTKALSAQYVETTNTPIFDAEPAPIVANN